MRHLPISIDLEGARVIVAGGGDAALAKLRILAKTPARLEVFTPAPSASLRRTAADARISARRVEAADLAGARLVYAASDDAAEDARVAALARSAGVLCNSVDNLAASDFITPAIVDRAPVTVAIATGGTAPVLARDIKQAVEALLPATTGVLAEIAGRFRAAASGRIAGAARRVFWRRYFDDVGPRALASGGPAAVEAALDEMLTAPAATGVSAGHVDLIGCGPGDPDFLTLRARRLIHDADVIVADRLIAPAVLDLARREAKFVHVGKIPGGPSWRQADINALLVAEARAGARVARLKSGDPGVFGRLDEETAALAAACVAFAVTPGVTAASAAAAAAGVSLTRRGRNAALRILTGHDAQGFAEHDWRALARPDATAAIYMGVRAAAYLQGRLLMHGAAADTPMCVVENAARPGQKIVAATLGDLARRMSAAGVAGPAIIFLGLAPQDAAVALNTSPTAAAGAF